MSQPLYRLLDRELLSRLMKRTSSGDAVSARQLAEAVGVGHQTITRLLNGVQQSVSASTAHAICNRIGCGVLLLFAPPEHADAHQAMAEAVSA